MSSTLKSSRDVGLHASSAPQFYAAAITSYILAVAAVALRFWARNLMSTRFWVDDWAIAGALVRSQYRIPDWINFVILTYLAADRYRVLRQCNVL